MGKHKLKSRVKRGTALVLWNKRERPEEDCKNDDDRDRGSSVFRRLNSEQNRENATQGEIQELKQPVDSTALLGASNGNAEVTKTKRTPNPKRPKFENVKNPPPPGGDSAKRQSKRIHQLQELKKKQEKAERRNLKSKEKKADRERRKALEESERRQKKENTEIYMSFIEDISPQYTVLPGKRQRMFRQAAIMLMNELLNEQEAEEACIEN